MIASARNATWTWLAAGAKGVFVGSFAVELVRSALVALLILGLGTGWRRLPKSLDLLKAKRFWGDGIAADGIAVCFGTLADSRLLDAEPAPFRYTKQFRDGRRVQISGPSDKITSLCEVRAASYFFNVLSGYRRVPLAIEDDQTFLKRLDRSIISLGSSVSNEITDIIEHDTRNRFLCIETGGKVPEIRCKATDRILEFAENATRTDHGIILKLVNKRFPEKYLFVCAGLGEWGTSGSAWYLAAHWKDLDELGDEFGVVVEVEIGSDQSARVVYHAGTFAKMPTRREAERVFARQDGIGP